MRTERVRAELGRILAFDDMRSSGQMSRFLTFVVEEMLAGRESQIKERRIAIGALDRDDRFDSRIDPIVRVVAGKLRRTLERYYLSVGADSDLGIEIPKGSYVPQFVSRDETAGSAADTPKPSQANAILRTKLHRPPQSSDLVDRKALLEQLNRHRHLPFTLVSAPAGYGKSTLISAWMEELDEPGAWLSLDDNDNDLRDFVGGIVAAVRTAFPTAAEATQTLLAVSALPPARVLSHQLLNDLDDIGQAFVLVLDDYHVIRESAVHELVAELLSHPSRNLHLTLLTRKDPDLPLDRLRGRGQLLELSMSDLHFTPAETAEFLRKALAVPVDETAVRTVSERVEGWPAGLRLLTQSLRHQEDLERAIGQWRGDAHAVLGYLVSEVLLGLPPHVANSLLRISILDRFCDPLCETLCDEDREAARCERDGQPLTSWLQSHNLFLIPLDTENRWFRLHHLFQSLLRDRLKQRLGDGEIAALQARASAWFEEQGLIEDAIAQALKAADDEGAADILTRSRVSLLNSDRSYELGKWLRRLPEAVAARRAGILLAKCWVAYLEGRITDIPPLLDRAEALMDDDEESAVALRGETDFFRSLVAYWQGDGELGLMCAKKALEQLPPQLEAARADAEIYLGLSQQMCGHQEAALQLMRNRARENTNREGLVLTRQLATISFIHYLDGRLQQAVEAAKQFRTVAQEGQYAVTDLWATYLAGSCHFQTYDLEAAVEQLGRVARSKYVFDPPFTVSCLAALAIAYQALQRPDDADETMRELAEFARASNDEPRMAPAESCRARLALLRGDRDAAERWLRGYDGSLDAPSMFFFLEVPFLTHCRVLLALGTRPALDEAAAQLQRAWDALRSLHNTFQSIEVGVLRALAFQSLAREDEALVALEETVALAAPGGWVRPFVEPGQPMMNLLSRLVDRGNGGTYAGRLLAKLSGSESAIVED